MNLAVCEIMKEYLADKNPNQQSDFSHLNEIDQNHDAQNIDVNEQEIRNLYVSL